MTGKRKRIKRPLTVFDKVTAKMFDESKCYFSNVSEDFNEPDERCAKGILRLTFGEFPYRYVKEDGGRKHKRGFVLSAGSVDCYGNKTDQPGIYGRYVYKSD